MENPTLQLIELLRLAHGGCSDYRIAKILEVEDSAVSRWVNARGHMSDTLITRACRAAHVEDPLRWRAFIGAERERGPEGDHWREKRDDFLRMESGLAPKEGSELHLFIKAIRERRLSSVLLASVVLGLFGRPISAEAYAPAADSSCAPSVYYGKSRRGWRRVLRWLKAKVPLPLQILAWTRARNRSTAFRLSSSLRSLAPT
jgi:hypothetical protein